MITSPLTDLRPGFQFTETDYIYVARTDDEGEWELGEVTSFRHLQISPAAAGLNYGQVAFEGLKALRTQNGGINIFRPKMNAIRFQNSAQRLMMPPLTQKQFIDAVKAVVLANVAWIPPFDPNLDITEQSSLYIRPVMIGSGSVLGVGPSKEYTFYIFVCPVGAYLPGPGRVIVLDGFHRVPSGGTGNIKAAGNYAGTMLPHKLANDKGYKDVLYLDAKSDQFIEELGSSNFFAVLSDKTLVTPPLSGNILPGITRDSILTLSEQTFGMRVEERPLHIKDVLESATEAFFTGTAAVVQPITEINYKGTNVFLGAGDNGNTLAMQLRRHLIGIQIGEIEDQWNWVEKVV